MKAIFIFSALAFFVSYLVMLWAATTHQIGAFENPWFIIATIGFFSFLTSAALTFQWAFPKTERRLN